MFNIGSRVRCINSDKCDRIIVAGGEYIVSGFNYDDIILEGVPLSWKPDRFELVGRPDIINSPSHHTAGGIEAIDVMRAKLTPEEFRGFLKGNVLKYVMRANHKGNHDEDIKKAGWYLNELRNLVDARILEESTDAKSRA